MHFGQRLEEDRWIKLARQAYDEGVRTFLTSDVYGIGQGDELLGKALEGIDRDSYCLAAMIGHDIYDGQRQGAKGYARFTNPDLRGPDGYEEYLERATKKCAERCGTDRFDVVMLHNPDSIGYSSPDVWSAMAKLREKRSRRRHRYCTWTSERICDRHGVLHREFPQRDRLRDDHPQSDGAMAGSLCSSHRKRV